MKIGLIRGGQLGLMLIEAGMRYGDHFFVLDSDPLAPCRNYCRDFTLGDPLDPNVVENFGKELDVLIVEFENISVEGLRRLEEKGIIVFPSSKVLASIQDKGLQKAFFKENNLPTSDFLRVENIEEVVQHLIQFPAVLKLPKGGYDGKGVVVAQGPEDIPKEWNFPLILEEKVSIEKELAVVVARDKKGNMAVYPTVEMAFHASQNMLDMVICPARISDALAQQAQELAKKTAEAYGIVGILAIEMFLTQAGDLLINEVSPRVHNSGHGTMEATQSSQFDQLLRLVHDLPLGEVSLISPVVMINLVGHPDHQGPVIYEGLEEVLASKGVFLHLYGKQETRPHRKMGHLTILNESLEEAMKQAIFIQKTLIVRS